MHSPGARVSSEAQSLWRDQPLWGDLWGKVVPLSSSIWEWGRETGRKFPICSAPILASPFVSLTICPTAPLALCSCCTCHKYQDRLCLCFKRQCGAHSPALPWPPALPSSHCCQPESCWRLAQWQGLSVPVSSLLGGLCLGGKGSALLFSLLLPQQVLGVSAKMGCIALTLLPSVGSRSMALGLELNLVTEVTPKEKRKKKENSATRTLAELGREMGRLRVPGLCPETVCADHPGGSLLRQIPARPFAEPSLGPSCCRGHRSRCFSPDPAF